MCPLALLSDKELQDQLRKLKSRPQQAKKTAKRPAQAQRLQHELQVHEIELEMQNRELREARQELEEARDRYADLYDFAPVGYLTFDVKGGIRELNLTAAGMLGVERLNAVGQPFSGWLPSGQSRAFFDHLRKVAQTNAGLVVELRVKPRRGDELFVRLQSIAEPGGEACRTAMTDITEARRQLLIEREREAELAHLARVSTLGAMASTIAHEISQPLNAIVAYAQAALHKLKKEPQEHAIVLDSLGKIVGLGRQAGDIVHSIGNFSRKGETPRKSVSLNDTGRAAVEMVSSSAVRAKVDLALDLCEGLPEVHGNSVQLEQVVVNLVMNALEAMKSHDGGTRQVIVRTSHADGAVRLSVADTGCGLAPEVAAHLFEPFFTTKPDGHGIGLALCRTIIRSHDGSIWAESAPSGGTIVTFSLPLPHEGRSA